MRNMIGGSAFIIGLVLSAAIAIFSSTVVPLWAIYTLAIIGVIVGFLNITEHESIGFLVASIAFLISFQALGTVFTVLTLGWQGVSAFFYLMSIFVAPAAAIVATKEILGAAKGR